MAALTPSGPPPAPPSGPSANPAPASPPTSDSAAPETPPLALRAELRFFNRTRGGEAELLVEDPVTSRFYRIGPREHAFMIRLDGRRAPGDALAEANATLDEPLSPDDASTIIEFLYREGLLRTEGELSHRRLDRLRKVRRLGTGLRRLNALIIRLPLGNPEPLLNALYPWLRWLQGPPPSSRAPCSGCWASSPC